MKKKTKHGFIGTLGLFIMVVSGLYMTGMAIYLVMKLMNGLPLDMAAPFLFTIVLGGVFPYLTGTLMFWWGKKVSNTPRH